MIQMTGYEMGHFRGLNERCIVSNSVRAQVQFYLHSLGNAVGGMDTFAFGCVQNAEDVTAEREKKWPSLKMVNNGVAWLLSGQYTCSCLLFTSKATRLQFHLARISTRPNCSPCPKAA
jgi:hypothetical protein